MFLYRTDTVFVLFAVALVSGTLLGLAQDKNAPDWLQTILAAPGLFALGIMALMVAFPLAALTFWAVVASLAGCIKLVDLFAPGTQHVLPWPMQLNKRISAWMLEVQKD